MLCLCSALSTFTHCRRRGQEAPRPNVDNPLPIEQWTGMPRTRLAGPEIFEGVGTQSANVNAHLVPVEQVPIKAEAS